MSNWKKSYPIVNFSALMNPDGGTRIFPRPRSHLHGSGRSDFPGNGRSDFPGSRCSDFGGSGRSIFFYTEVSDQFYMGVGVRFHMGVGVHTCLRKTVTQVQHGETGGTPGDDPTRT